MTRMWSIITNKFAIVHPNTAQLSYSPDVLNLDVLLMILLYLDGLNGFLQALKNKKPS